jgi:hypothetical protein
MTHMEGGRCVAHEGSAAAVPWNDIRLRVHEQLRVHLLVRKLDLAKILQRLGRIELGARVGAQRVECVTVRARESACIGAISNNERKTAFSGKNEI